eukprot:m.20091 g.20091  ORF g.20091 m.20091 type:complete len:90 (+) comp8543_c0_seq1:2679-2948(+)
MFNTLPMQGNALLRNMSYANIVSPSSLDGEILRIKVSSPPPTASIIGCSTINNTSSVVLSIQLLEWWFSQFRRHRMSGVQPILLLPFLG